MKFLQYKILKNICEKNLLSILKIDFKVEINVYSDFVNVDMLDNWIDTLEIYFTIYKYSSSENIQVESLKFQVMISYSESYITNGKIYQH